MGMSRYIGSCKDEQSPQGMSVLLCSLIPIRISSLFKWHYNISGSKRAVIKELNINVNVHPTPALVFVTKCPLGSLCTVNYFLPKANLLECTYTCTLEVHLLDTSPMRTSTEDGSLIMDTFARPSGVHRTSTVILYLRPHFAMQVHEDCSKLLTLGSSRKLVTVVRGGS